jgi:Acetyltransferase (GNAT) domain
MESTIEMTFLSNMMNIQVVSPIDAAWQECLNSIPHDFYHLPEYLELEAKRHDATAEAIIIKDADRVFFLPYIIRDCDRIASLPRLGSDRIYDIISPYGYPGMLVSTTGQNSRFIEKCLDLIYGYWQEKNICSAFLRLHPILNSYIDSSIGDRYPFGNGDLTQERLRHRGEVVVCDLTIDIDDIWKQMRSNHRTKINKLRRSGFVTTMVSTDKYLDVFIDIYIETMNRVNATQGYYFTRDYFHRFCQALGDRAQICIVETAGEIIAASLITEFSGIVQYHLGGTRTEFLPHSPTTIVFDYMIKWAKQRNNQYLNLGGGLSGNRDSLYHFKSGFSHQTKSFITIETIVNRSLYDHLTNIRAESLGIVASEIHNASFFPAYRSG